MKGIVNTVIFSVLMFSANVMANSYSDKAEFDQYHAQQQAAKLQFITRQETKLAFREYTSKTAPQAVLVFYHSTGTHSGITYPDLATQLSHNFPLVVITPDMRGHGFSGGTRGDTPSVQAMFDDMNSHIQDARSRYPKLPIILGGHSSGAGLVINHSGYEKALPVDGYVFLAPYMGPVAPVFRDGVKNDFITIDFQLFAENANKGTEAHTQAIFYHFPDDILQRYPEIVPAITVEMALATNAQWPYHQLRDIQQPIAMWVGEKDEGLDPSKLAYFLQNANAQAHTQILPDQNHISLVAKTHELMGKWIMQNSQVPQTTHASTP